MIFKTEETLIEGDQNVVKRVYQLNPETEYDII